jgi:pentatricopeptide repeat protein
MRRIARFSCVGLSACLAAALIAASHAAAEEPLRFKLEYDKITAEFNDALRGKTGDVANYRAATAAREAAVTKLIERAEAAKSQEHTPLAMAYQSVGRLDDAIREARAALAEKKSSLNYTILIGALCLDGKVEEAEKALAEAKEALGEKERYVSFHQTIASGYQRLKRDDEAATHIAEVLDGMWPSLVSTPDRLSKTYLQYLNRLATTELSAANAVKILPTLEKLEKRMAAEAGDNDKLAPISAALRSVKEHVQSAAGGEKGPARVRAKTTARTVSDTKETETKKSGDATPAKPQTTAAPRTISGRSAPPTVTDEELAEAETKLKADPKDKDALGTVLKSKLGKLRSATEREAAEKIIADLREFVDKNLETMADSREFIGAASFAFGNRVSGLINSEKFDDAEKAVNDWKARLAGLKTDGDEAKAAVAGAVKSAELMLGRIEGAKKRAALVGQPYFPIEEATWLNGSPLKPEELRGKVVLLDFWAVWCGPCIATFPHLKHWHEEYGDKGLVIIGVTNRYKFDWDAEAKRPKNVDDLAPEKEDAATTQFVEHYGLKHRIAVMSERTLSGKYEVTGIPQAVLIDRQGLIRLIKVGSGDANAEAMEAAIRKALDLPVAKAGE